MQSKPSSFSSAVSDIRLLLWKNFIIQWRHPLLSLVELLLPCLLVFILSMFRGSVDVTVYPTPTVYEPFNLNDVERTWLKAKGTFELLYTPISDQNKVIMEETATQLANKLKATFTAVPFNSTLDMEDHYLMSAKDDILCGVEFLETAPSKLHFKLRFTSVPRHFTNSYVRETWQTVHIMPELASPGPREKNHPNGGKPGYLREAFLLVQHELTLATAKVLHGEPPHKEAFEFKMARFPFPPYINDLFLFLLSFLFPSLIVFSFIYGSVNLTKSLVIEKERRLKESMKMMGLREQYHWMAHFIKATIWTLPSLIILVVLLCTKLKNDIAILNFSNPVVLFLFFFTYEISNICLCFLISTFFSKANLAGIATGVIFFFTSLPFFTVVAQYNTVSGFLKVALCFLPNTNLGLGVYTIIMKESRAVGISWNNLAEPSLPGDTLNLALILGIKLVNSSIYLLLTWYITQAFPGEFGVSLPWYFPFTLTYWRGKEEAKNITTNGISLSNEENNQPNIEADPLNLKAGIEIRNLGKSYDGGNTHSVNKLNLNLFHGQITSLLGHNGAGKTTTISILTGLNEPTFGTAIINGYDIRTSSSMNAIRSTLGVCPQFNVLFDELSVEEHLEFYCKLKRADLDRAAIKEEVTSIINKLDLADKRKKQAHTLSGGQQRKLSVGIAFIGDSSVVILDEPTSGMDVSARRFIWDLLLAEKRHRCILISTHFMEEADILGDRIAIMAEGKLQCCGSPLYLKSQYGDGYHLTVSKKNPKVDTQAITEIISGNIPGAKLESSVGVEVTYSLPDESTKYFEPLLSKLETEDNELGIENYAISVTTMEEVFLKVGDYAKEKIGAMTQRNTNGHQGAGVPKLKGQPSAGKNVGFRLLGQRLYGLVLKKVLYSFRSPFLTGAQLLIPFLILNMSLIALKAIPQIKEAPPLHMSLTQFSNPRVTYFYENTSQVAKLASKFADSLQSRVSHLTGIASIEPLEIVQNLALKPSPSVYSYELMISAVLSQRSNDSTYTMVGLFNNQAFHTPSIALKILDETYLRFAYGLSNLSITITNLPLPLTTRDNMKISPMTQNRQFQITQGLILGIAFLVGSFAVLVVRERVSKGKHLQRLSGVSSWTYYLSFFLTDYLIYLASSAFMIIAFVIYQEGGLYQNYQPAYLALGFALHGFAILPCVYALSYMFATPATAYARLCLYVTVLGIAAILSDQITSIKALDLLSSNRILKPIFSLLIPVYDLGKLTSNLITNYDLNQVCTLELIKFACSLPTPPSQVLPCCKDKCTGDSCLDWEENFLALTEPGIGGNLLYILASSLIFLTILALMELNVHKWLAESGQFLWNSIRNRKETQNTSFVDLDDDVEREKKEIAAMDAQKRKDTNPLIVRQLVKRYGTFTAVNDISFTVPRGSIFGLIGENGAGKTSTFGMITGDLSISSGDIFVNGLSLKGNIQQAQQEIGYCPQFDALLDNLTGRETLALYSRLRGIPEGQIPHQVEELSHLLYFEMHVDKLVGQYSGGNKRKLSTAIALLGNPSISFLDEPTTGVDPVARRCFWEAISEKLKQGCSVVLTSHSLDECETLCDRLCILSSGRIACIGSPLHLKNKFSTGYTVHLRVSSFSSLTENTQVKVQSKFSESALKGNIAAVEAFINDSFPKSTLKAIHNNMLHYTIDTCGGSVKCSQIFGLIEKNKARLQIEDYSVCQTNLEQIFLSFARKQRDRDGKKAENGQQTVIEIATRL